jgi:hypothetical protein
MTRALVLVAFVACSHPPRPPMHTTDCSAAIAGFASGDPAQFRPLPSTCTLAEVSATLKSLETETRGVLGEGNNTMRLRWFASAAIPQILVWIDSAGHVVRLDADMPPSGSVDAYIKALGQPEQRLDYKWRSSTLANGELVWLTHGVSTVGAPNGNGLIRAGVFVPANLADYRARLRFIDDNVED